MGGAVAQAEQATRKSELRVVEDQVDAVLCAYVALFATREPARTTTYGDFETGYIVTPTLPEGQQPTPRERRARLVEDPVREAVREYAARHADAARGQRALRRGWSPRSSTTPASTT